MAYGIIKIGEKEVPMRATAATPHRYKQVFRSDVMPYFEESCKASPSEYAEMISKLAYIMAKSAEGADMTKLSQEDYFSWLDGFNAFDFATSENVIAIANIYAGNAETFQTVKKSPDPQNGK